jgi:DNA-directed RNA polymerase specialized sigma24 family protein
LRSDQKEVFVFRYISVPVVTQSLDELIESGRTGLLERGSATSSRPIEEDCEFTAMKAAIRQFVSSLPPHDRDLVESVFWRDVSQAEAARSLGLSRMAITKRLKKIYRAGVSALATFDSVNS